MLQLFVLLAVFLHPFYVSVTEIRHNVKNKTVEVSSRLFFDDFEAALERQYHDKLNILKPADKNKADKMISAYIKKHLLISIDGRPADLQYVGYEIEEDGAWCYFEIKGVDKADNISVVNNILFEEHASQINMLHVIVNGQRKSTKLDNPQSRAVFKF